MRSPKVLEKMATGTLAMTKGECRFDLLALDDDEAEWFATFLKGKHNTKLVGIHRGSPGDEVPWMDRLATAPARTVGTLTEDGY